MIKYIFDTEKLQQDQSVNTNFSEGSAATQAKVAASFDLLLQRDDIGFFKVLDNTQAFVDSQNLAQQFQKKYKKLCVVGIGGSSLGTEAFRDFFYLSSIEIFDNVDPRRIESQFTSIADLNDCAWAIISKTGSTIETLAIFELVIELYEKKNIEWKERCIVITEKKKSSLYDFALKNQISFLEVPQNIGGRFSVFSPVGLFPMAFAGMDLNQVKQGIKNALENKAATLGLILQFLNSFQRKEWLTSFWFYSSSCQGLGKWCSQLWAESICKKVNRKNQEAERVSTPIWMIGACDQHSLLQQWAEGAKDKFVLFIDFTDLHQKDFQFTKPHFSETQLLGQSTLGELLLLESRATRESLNIAGVSNMQIQIPKNDIAHIAEFMMTMMLVVGGIGEYLDINAFDQPGVELGKRLARKYLSSL